MMAVALGAPKPAPAPEPAPQVYTYTAGVDYVYPAGLPSVVSPYSTPFAYSAPVPAAVYLR